jgi:hypothetical protein
MLGVPVGAAEIAEGSTEDGKFVAIYQEDGKLTGALCVNLPSRLRHWRKEIIAAATRV